MVDKKFFRETFPEPAADTSQTTSPRPESQGWDRDSIGSGSQTMDDGSYRSVCWIGGACYLLILKMLVWGALLSGNEVCIH